jgi:pilus assembly protein CpaB
MNRSRLLMIGGLALAIGLLVSYTVYTRLRTSANSNNVSGVPVVVAASDIQVGAKLAPNDVRVVTIPPSSVPPGAFSSPSKIIGRGAILPVTKGDFILPSKLAPVNAGSGLPSMIPQGMRAVSVRVNDVVSVAGFVQPGSHVDVLATGNPGSGSERQTFTVLENVLVLAVGKNLERNISEAAQLAPVITLAVSPDDAQKLALVSEGRIQLALRNPLDTKQGDISVTRASAVYPGEKPAASDARPKPRKVVAKAAPPAPPAPYQVEMIRGSKRDETKFDDNNKQ